MCMKADYCGIAVGQVATEIFDLVGIDVGRCRLDCGRQVEDDRLFAGRLEHVHHRCAHLDAKVDLGG